MEHNACAPFIVWWSKRLMQHVVDPYIRDPFPLISAMVRWKGNKIQYITTQDMLLREASIREHCKTRKDSRQSVGNMSPLTLTFTPRRSPDKVQKTQI